MNNCVRNLNKTNAKKDKFKKNIFINLRLNKCLPKCLVAAFAGRLFHQVGWFLVPSASHS